jgi:hypothetical protein
LAALTPASKPGLELLDEVDLDATDEADLVGLGLQAGCDADEERALLLGERQRCDVRRLDDGVDDREVRVGVRLAPAVTASVQRKPTPIDELVAVVDEQLETLCTVPSLVGRRLGADDGEVFRRRSRPCGARVVERLVAATGDVEQRPTVAPSAGSPPAVVPSRRGVRCLGRVRRLGRVGGLRGVGRLGRVRAAVVSAAAGGLADVAAGAAVDAAVLPWCSALLVVEPHAAPTRLIVAASARPRRAS